MGGGRNRGAPCAVAVGAPLAVAVAVDACAGDDDVRFVLPSAYIPAAPAQKLRMRRVVRSDGGPPEAARFCAPLTLPSGRKAGGREIDGEMRQLRPHAPGEAARGLTGAAPAGTRRQSLERRVSHTGVSLPSARASSLAPLRRGAKSSLPPNRFSTRSPARGARLRRRPDRRALPAVAAHIRGSGSRPLAPLPSATRVYGAPRGGARRRPHCADLSRRSRRD